MNRIDNAVLEMEQLVHTFLLMARNEDDENISVDISEKTIQKIIRDFEPTIQANQVNFHQELQCDFRLNAQPRGYEGFGIGLNIVRDI